MLFVLSLSLLWVCFGAQHTIQEQLSWVSPHNALHNVSNLPFLSSINKDWNHEGVLIRRIQLEIKAMGNRLSWYFDSLACADIVGIHFAWPSLIVAYDEQERKFLSSFPATVVHPHPSNASQEELVSAMKKECPHVLQFPHERRGAWNQRPAIISAIMRDAVQAVFSDVRTVTIPRDSVEYLFPSDHKESQLPLVPSAAILFRCVDILYNGEYGFVNFNVYKELIPANATHIYVLSENLAYENAKDDVNRKHCVDVGHHLVDFLHTTFPRAVVAIRRGHAVDSVAILANAEVVVSAPSTFVLFPGIANPHKVYLMPGKLFLDLPFLRDQFFWITSPGTVYGENLVRPHEAGALQKYKTAFTAPLTEKVEVVTHTSKRVGN